MDTLELIDKYVDNQLSQIQTQQLEENLRQDAELQQLLDSVIIARKAIRFRALTIKVRGLHEQYIDEVRTETSRDNVRILPVSRTYSWALRIAASVLLVLFGYGGYQYTSLDSTHIYQDKFISYQLPTTRGNAETLTSLNALYVSGNYGAVIQRFNDLESKSPSDYFLAGVSYLQQKEYAQAVTTFTALQQYNQQHKEAYFAQETDYYLGLAYLGNDQVDQAYTLFKTIHGTSRHLFRESVTQLDLLKLNLLRLKK